MIRRSALVYASLVCVCLLLASCGSPLGTAGSEGTTPLRTPALATIHVMSTPDGAAIYLDGALRGDTPNAFVLQAGRHRIRLEKPGYAPQVVDLVLEAGREVVVRRELLDNVPPRIDMSDVPTAVRASEGLKVSASAEDEQGVVAMALLVDGRRIEEVGEASLRHNLDTTALSPGTHTLVLEARDGEGNLARKHVVFELLAPTVTPSATTAEQHKVADLPTTRPSATSSPSATSTAHPSPVPTSVATQVESPVSVSWDEVSISAYAYKEALYSDPERAGHPYPLLDRGQVGPPEARKYRVLRMRNEYLELTLLPELGGRIYQCCFLPTGQDLFYNNRTVKPTHWGPADQGWWLAVGGVEFCLPVDEHGYLTAEPWNLEVIRHAHGSATASMSILERSRNVEARVDVTLRPHEAGFRIRSTLHNPGAEPRSLQYWINAMLSPGSHGVGPSLRFYYPTSQVVVHSTGDSSLPRAGETMAWPICGGRDMSLYANWSDWLGFFAPDLRAPFTAVYDEEAELGMVRVFPPGVARGTKLFAFGLHFGDAGVYTDDGSQYVEMWGGLTPTFGDYAVLEPRTTIAWEETWYVISRCGGPSLATGEAMLRVARDEGHLELAVSSPGGHRWLLRVARGHEQIAQEAFAVRPDTPFHTRIDLPAETSHDSVVVTIEDPVTHSLVLSYVA